MTGVNFWCIDWGADASDSLAAGWSFYGMLKLKDLINAPKHLTHSNQHGQTKYRVELFDGDAKLMSLELTVAKRLGSGNK